MIIFGYSFGEKNSFLSHILNEAVTLKQTHPFKPYCLEKVRNIWDARKQREIHDKPTVASPPEAVWPQVGWDRRWLTQRHLRNLIFRWIYVCVHAKSLQLCPTVGDPMDCSPTGSPVHGILQARILEWVGVPSSRDLPDPGIEPVSLASPALEGFLFLCYQ